MGYFVGNPCLHDADDDAFMMMVGKGLAGCEIMSSDWFVGRRKGVWSSTSEEEEEEMKQKGEEEEIAPNPLHY